MMYQYRDGDMDVTIILGHITSVYCKKESSVFRVYLTDKGEPNAIPTKLYDDFMNKLNSYVKSQAQ